MNDEDLVEKFMLHVPTTVLGSSFTPEIIKAVQKGVDNLRTQLAKANKRVKELESHIEECDEYLDINRYTAIGNMSILHRQMKQLRKEQEQ